MVLLLVFDRLAHASSVASWEVLPRGVCVCEIIVRWDVGASGLCVFYHLVNQPRLVHMVVGGYAFCVSSRIMFASVTLSKASHMANSRVSVEGHYQRGWL